MLIALVLLYSSLADILYFDVCPRRLYTSSWARWLAPGAYCNSMVSRPDALDPARWPAVGFFTPRWKRVFAGKVVLLVRGAAPVAIP